MVEVLVVAVGWEGGTLRSGGWAGTGERLDAGAVVGQEG